MANAKVDVVGLSEIPTMVELYREVYRPARDAEFFRRRFMGRYNPALNSSQACSLSG
jgi:hypothetical protein